MIVSQRRVQRCQPDRLESSGCGIPKDLGLNLSGQFWMFQLHQKVKARTVGQDQSVFCDRSRGSGELSTSVSKSPPVRGAQVRSHGLGGPLRAGFEARAHAHHRVGCAPRDERWDAGAVDDRDRARCRDWLSAFLHAWRGEVQWRISSQLAQQSR